MENTTEVSKIECSIPATGEAEDNAEAQTSKKEKHKKKIKSIFSRDFVIDSLFLDKKDIKNYITGKAIPILGDDYYYGYTYKDGRLSFIAQRSNSMDVGHLSAFAPAFLKPGAYMYKDGMKYYVINHAEDGIVKAYVHYELPAEATDISEMNINDISEEIPPTLFFKWSLARNQRPMNLVLLAVFVLTLIAFAWSAQSYSDLSRRTATLGEQGQSANHSTADRLPDITEVVKECVKRVDGRGTIRQVRTENEAIVFTIQFPIENDARDFIAKNGGKYENDQVVLALVAPHNSQPVPGK